MLILNKIDSLILASLGFAKSTDNVWCTTTIKSSKSNYIFRANGSVYNTNLVLNHLNRSDLVNNFTYAPYVFDAVLWLESNIKVKIDLIYTGDNYKWEIEVNNSILPFGDLRCSSVGTYKTKDFAYEAAVHHILDISRSYRWSERLKIL